jgi:nitrogenase molybdenum-iron protein alpha chain
MVKTVPRAVACKEKYMKLVNLANPSLPVREQRLGSIINYDGTAADLAAQSREGRLRDRACSFTQVSSCASSCAVCLLSLIQDAAVVNHGPLGCSGDFSAFNLVHRYGLVKRNQAAANVRMVSSNLGESDAIFGGETKLEQAIRDAFARFNPKVIFVTASCASAITGEDIDALTLRLEEELGVPIGTVHCEGFRSKVWTTGFDAAYHAILRKVVKPPREKHPDVVNVITFWGQDVFSELFARLGLKANLVVPFASVEQLRHLSESAATVQMCSTLGTYFAAGLEELYGVAEVKAPPPYGLAGTDAWLRALAKVTGKETEVEALIADEHAAIADELGELREKLRGLRGYVAAGSVHGHSLSAVLRELGMEVAGSCFWHHDARFDNNDPNADSLQHLVKSYGDLPVSICNKQAYEMINQLRRVKPDVFVVRHPGMAVWGGKLGIPTFLVEDEHYSLAYKGLLRFGHRIFDAVNNPSFYRNLSRHARLPYTEWWLKQKSNVFLGAEQ